MRTRVIVLFLLFMFIFALQADCDEVSRVRTLFFKGNAYYSEEKFQQAIAQYEEALRFGFESGELYYNLGNAYFKNGSLGKAVLNYLRAKRLIPKDADLNSNLEYAQSLIRGGIAIPERNWFMSIFFNFVDSFSLDRATWISAVLYFTLCTLLIFIILAKRRRKIIVYAGGLILILLIVSLPVFSVQFYKTIIRKQAVVTVSSTDSKFEPFSDATTFFVLEEGESVTLISYKEGWAKVKRIDGKQGWIKASDIEFL